MILSAKNAITAVSIVPILLVILAFLVFKIPLIIDNLYRQTDNVFAIWDTMIQILTYFANSAILHVWLVKFLAYLNVKHAITPYNIEICPIIGVPILAFV